MENFRSFFGGIVLLLIALVCFAIAISIFRSGEWKMGLLFLTGVGVFGALACVAFRSVDWAQYGDTAFCLLSLGGSLVLVFLYSYFHAKHQR